MKEKDRRTKECSKNSWDDERERQVQEFTWPCRTRTWKQTPHRRPHEKGKTRSQNEQKKDYIKYKRKKE